MLDALRLQKLHPLSNNRLPPGCSPQEDEKQVFISDLNITDESHLIPLPLKCDDESVLSNIDTVAAPTFRLSDNQRRDKSAQSASINHIRAMKEKRFPCGLPGPDLAGCFPPSDAV